MAQRNLRALRPVSCGRVTIDGGFWKKRLDVVRKSTISLQHAKLADTGRLEAWRLEWKPACGKEPPHVYWDSDVAKWLEAAAYIVGAFPDRKLEGEVGRIIDMIADAQEPDGYVNTHFQVADRDRRWANLFSAHELYCAGHLIEAAVALHEATGGRKLLDVLCRYADYIHRTFGRGKGRIRGYPGHEEIELALVKLYRATGRHRYLDLAKYFIGERGRIPNYFLREAETRGVKLWRPPEYCQAHKPVREQSEVTGHAVRAMYLYSGMADLALETDDETLVVALNKLWRNLVTKRMYVTGGIGPASHNEGFTADYDLPNESAYAETCAAIGLVFWARRMLELRPDGEYADVMERALYNGVLSGLSLDGTRFFYANPLASCPPATGGAAGTAANIVGARREWFGCACCPPNVARLVASIGGYVYGVSASTAYVHLYAASTAEVDVAGRSVRLVQETEYPWAETVALTVEPDTPAAFSLALRMPGWCRKPSLKVNGSPVDVAKHLRRGYAVIRRKWSPEDRVELRLPMPAERVEAHPSVRQDAGRVALMRGPIVYCLEEVDNGPDLADLALPRTSRLEARYEPRLLGGVTTVTGRARRRSRSGWKGALYRRELSETETMTMKAVPYALWANRREGEMMVWINSCPK